MPKFKDREEVRIALGFGEFDKAAEVMNLRPLYNIGVSLDEAVMRQTGRTTRMILCDS